MENMSPDLDDLKKNIRRSSGIVTPGRCLIINPVRLFRTLLKSQIWFVFPTTCDRPSPPRSLSSSPPRHKTNTTPKCLPLLFPRHLILILRGQRGTYVIRRGLHWNPIYRSTAPTARSTTPPARPIVIMTMCMIVP